MELEHQNKILEQLIRNKKLLKRLKSGIPSRYDKAKVINYLLKSILEPNKGLSDRLKRMIDLNGKKVIDLGSGSGFDSMDVAEEGAFVIGLEISNRRFDFNIEFMKEKNLFHPLVKADVCLLPFKTCSIDIIVCRHLIEHLPEPEKRIESFFNFLSKEGILYIDFPNKYSVKQIISDEHYNLPFIVLLPRFIAGFVVTKIFKYEKHHSTNMFLSPYFFEKIMKKLNKKFIYLYPDFSLIENKINNPKSIQNEFLRAFFLLIKHLRMNQGIIFLLKRKIVRTIIFPNFVSIVLKE